MNRNSNFYVYLHHVQNCGHASSKKRHTFLSNNSLQQGLKTDSKMSTNPTQTTSQNQQVADWFENLIADIRVDQIQIEAGVADTDKAEFYRNLMSGKQDEVFKKIRFEASQLLIERVVKTFIAELSSRKCFPEKLAFALTPSTIMVWAEINDDDDRVEDGILLSESKVNAFAKQYDFALDTMIVEKSDKLEVPSHYYPVNIRKKQQSVA